MIIYSLACNGCYTSYESKNIAGLCPECKEEKATCEVVEARHEEDWIHVSEGEPENGEYLCRAKRWDEECFVVLTFKEGTWFNLAEVMSLEITFQGEVTHYRPLPEPPKGENVGNTHKV